MAKIMIIEDDYKLRLHLQDSLERYGFSVLSTDDFKNVEAFFEDNTPDLVILDITLPYYDGFYLCRMFRRKSKIPIIVISARSSSVEQLMGLEMGADDYITKPFDMEILIAKVKASLRRVEYTETSQEKKLIKLKGLSLDEDNFKLNYKEKAMDLSKNEFRIIRKFMENPDKIVSREDLLADLWEESFQVDDNTLTVNIARVKTKLEQLGFEGLIKTKRGIGYLMDTSVLGV